MFQPVVDVSRVTVTRCEASSELVNFGEKYGCNRATDDKTGYNDAWISNLNEMSWIKLTFASDVIVDHLEFYAACSVSDQCSRYDVSFSDGSHQTVSNVTADSKWHIEIIMTDVSVRLTVLGSALRWRC